MSSENNRKPAPAPSRAIAALLSCLMAAGPSAVLAVDGGYDPNFAMGGRRLVGVSDAVDELAGLALRPDRRILLSGSCASSDINGAAVSTFCAAKLSATGALTAFGIPSQPHGPGRLLLTDLRTQAAGEDLYAYASALDRQARLLIAGQRRSEQTQAALARIAADGRSLQTLYLQPLATGEQEPSFFALHLDTAQRVLLAGNVVRNDRVNAMLVRLTPSLQPDPTFGLQGVVYMDDPEYQISPTAIAADSQGRIVLLTVLTPITAVQAAIQISRLTPVGGMDTSFHGNGAVKVDELPSAVLTGLAIDASDRVLAFGHYTQSSEGDRDLFLLRLTSSGEFDPSIPPSPGVGQGARLFEIEDLVNVGPNEKAGDLLVQTDGRIVLVGTAQRLGSANSQFLSMRIADNADLDPSYGVGGISVGTFEGAPFNGSSDIGLKLAFDSAGSLVVAGTAIGSDLLAVEDFGVARLDNSGAVGDRLFQTGFE